MAAVKNCVRERSDGGNRGMNAKKGPPRCKLSLHRDYSCTEKKAILFTSLLRKYFNAKPSWTLFTNYSLHGFLLKKKSAFNINCTIAAAFVHRLSLFDSTWCIPGESLKQNRHIVECNLYLIDPDKRFCWSNNKIWLLFDKILNFYVLI